MSLFLSKLQTHLLTGIRNLCACASLQVYILLESFLPAVQANKEHCSSEGGEEKEGSCPAAAPAWAWPTAASGEPPLLGLVMIIKNENATIEATLESVKHDIDYWTIVDTGSTDGTQDTVRAAMADVPGQLLSQPFVDFSTTRNFALKVPQHSLAACKPCAIGRAKGSALRVQLTFIDKIIKRA